MQEVFKNKILWHLKGDSIWILDATRTSRKSMNPIKLFAALEYSEVSWQQLKR